MNRSRHNTPIQVYIERGDYYASICDQTTKITN